MSILTCLSGVFCLFILIHIANKWNNIQDKKWNIGDVANIFARVDKFIIGKVGKGFFYMLAVDEDLLQDS